MGFEPSDEGDLYYHGVTLIASLALEPEDHVGWSAQLAAGCHTLERPM